MTPVRGLDGLPQRIAAVCRRLGLSQRVFAERLDVGRNVVIRWERGINRRDAEVAARRARGAR
jgi:DNA-binding transcriptional regulator YiaG